MFLSLCFSIVVLKEERFCFGWFLTTCIYLGTGLAKYPKTQFAELKNKLSACLADGAKGLPTHKEVPIYFAATAGMRLLRYYIFFIFVQQCL